MQLPRFSLQSLLILMLLFGSGLATWDYVRMRKREVELRDDYERLLREHSIDDMAFGLHLITMKTLRDVVKKHGLEAEAEEAYYAEVQKHEQTLNKSSRH